jgi:hypothetical protein
MLLYGVQFLRNSVKLISVSGGFPLVSFDAPATNKPKSVNFEI